MLEIYDHNHRPARHMCARVNNIRMHYVVSGEGESLLLLHGILKTYYYWYRLIPLLTEHYTAIASDLRGSGDTDKPPMEDGYDSLTNASDMAGLMRQLGYDRYYVHGEDREAEFAYMLAATNPDRVKTPSFCEMPLSGEDLDTMSYFTKDNVRRQYNQNGTWRQHIPFFWIAHISEMLISGYEEEFWSYWTKAETWNPNAIPEECIKEWISHIEEPGGLRGVLETYRVAFKNAEVNAELKESKTTMPVMATSAPEFFGNTAEKQMRELADNVMSGQVSEECGHSLALEAPERLADVLIHFFSWIKLYLTLSRL